MSTKFDSQLKESEIAERESAPRVSFETAERNAVPPEPGGHDDALKEQHRSPGSSEALRARLVAVHARCEAPDRQGQELFDCPVVGGSCVRVADRNRKKLEDFFREAFHDGQILLPCWMGRR